MRQLALSCWYLTGATASGKTLVSIALAKKIDAEIISLDSMAIYRGMNIGTAKPAAEYQKVVPHHLIDIVDPVQSFSVSQYQERALEKIAEIQSRGKQVLFVGGTPLYLKVMLRGLFDGPRADWEFRQLVEDELADAEVELLHRRLEMVDPVTAKRVHVNDRRRIIRALEVYRATGVPISHWQMQFDQANPREKCRVFTLRHPRPVLHQRIEARVEWMFRSGLVEEVQTLLDKWGKLSRTAAQAVGYHEAIEYLSGERDLMATIEKVRVRTRRFARHQETWFRGLQECRMIDVVQPYSDQEIANKIFEQSAIAS
jgi:tRNA dimethylallyltransferase